MAILGASTYQKAIPKAGGGYYVSTKKGKTIKHTTVSAPKKTTTTKKKTTVAKISTPKATTKSYPTASLAAVNATATPVVSAPSMDDLVSKYLKSSTADVNSIYDKQKSSQLAELKAQRTAAINKINVQKKTTAQDYYDKRNQADVTNAQNVQKLREIMAANGVSTSGENLTLNAQANSDRLNSLNSLNQQEQSQMNDYANQIADWNSPTKDQAITNDIETARAKALLDAKNNAIEKAWRDYIYNNMSAAQQAQLAMSKYSTDSTNASNAASSQAALDYYSSLGFSGSSGGGGTQYKSDLQQALAKGLDSSWVGALNYIVGKESSYNSSAKNPTSSAYGYGQFLNSTRANYEKKMGLSYSNPVNQLLMTVQYMKDRYGTPQNAIAFKQKNGWY